MRQPTIKPATLFQRAVAYIADKMLLVILWLMAQMAFGFDIVESSQSINFINWLFSTAYFIYFHKANGATPGKRLMEIRVISIDGMPLTWLQSFLRYTPYSFFLALQIFMTIDQAATTIDPAAQLLALVLCAWGGASIYMIAMRPDRRTLHDFLAYTQVIHTPSQSTAQR